MRAEARGWRLICPALQVRPHQANIDKDELRFFQEVAKELLGLDEVQITMALSAGEIVEMCHGDKEA